MMKLAGPLVVVALLAGPATADKVITQDDVVDMIAKRDVAGIKAISQFPLELRDLWFPDAKCAELSMKWAKVEAAKLPLAVDCLADLGLRMEGRWAVYDPGVAVAVGVNDNVLRGFGSYTPIDAATPLIHTSKFLEKLAGKPEVPADAATRAALAKTVNGHAAVEVRICIAASGAIDRVTTSENEQYPEYERTVEKAVRGWKVAPFTRGGKAMRVCVDVDIAYPAHHRKPMETWGPFPPPPLHPPSPTRAASPRPSVPNVSPQLLEGVRVAGSKVIVPDDTTKLAIQASGQERFVGTFRLCISDSGVPTTVTMLKSTGFPRYDATLESEMKKWRYKPYEIDGKPAAVCTAITFIYTQK